MLSEIYKGCMLIGNRFNQKYYGMEETYDWHGSEECATVAKLTYELMSTLNISMEKAFDTVMEIAIANGFRKVEDHMWDDYCKGFLAGEFLGAPTQENLFKATIAEHLWDEDSDADQQRFGYYQEVLNAII